MISFRLISSDRFEFLVEKGTAVRVCGLVKDLVEDMGEDGSLETGIPISEVDRAVLSMIVNWCKHHQSNPYPTTDEVNQKKTTELGDWDKSFFQVDQEMVFGIILGANFLDVPQLLEMGCQVIAELMKEKNSDEVRELFSLEDDLNPQEKEQIREENEWAEDRWDCHRVRGV